MQKLMILAALTFGLQAAAFAAYKCDVSGIVELQKQPFLSKKWKPKSSSRENLCPNGLNLDFGRSNYLVLECAKRIGNYNYKLTFASSIIGNENFNMKVDLGRNFYTGNSAGDTIIDRDITKGESFEDEISFEFPMVEDKNERTVLRSVRLICHP